MEGHKSYPFNVYLNSILKGNEVEIYNSLRKLYILDEHGQPLKCLKYSKSIDKDLVVHDLLKENIPVGDYTYGVFVHKNEYDLWLYKSKIVHRI